MKYFFFKSVGVLGGSLELGKGNSGWVPSLVMSFGLKNDGATYQRAMNAIFHDMLGHHMKIYIDDIVVKSTKAKKHVNNLRKSFERMRLHQLKLNSLKCAFGVEAGNFIGFWFTEEE